MPVASSFTSKKAMASPLSGKPRNHQGIKALSFISKYIEVGSINTILPLCWNFPFHSVLAQPARSRSREPKSAGRVLYIVLGKYNRKCKRSSVNSRPRWALTNHAKQIRGNSAPSTIVFISEEDLRGLQKSCGLEIFCSSSQEHAIVSELSWAIVFIFLSPQEQSPHTS